MSTIYYPVEKATVKFVTDNGTYSKMKLQAINGVNITNAFNIPYVRGVVGTFNLIISRFMFFAEKDPKKRAQEYIYMSGAEGSTVINKCESQYWNIVRSLERIVGVKIKRAHESHGANTFRLTQQTIEFLNIFTEGELQSYINKYKIDELDLYALRQLYNYRVVRPTDGNMTRPEREKFYAFMKNRKHRDFLHYCAQNNITPESRVVEIEAHMDFLSPKQREQLSKIKALLKATPGKLKHYFHWLLIKIQQFVSFKKNEHDITSKNNDQQNTRKSQNVDRNKTEGEQRTTEEVAQAHKKDPEDVTYQDIVEVAVLWNIMATGRQVDTIINLTDKKIESIYNLVKYHSKETVIYTIKNIGCLYKADNMNNLIQFKDFVRDHEQEHSRFNKVSSKTHPDTRLSATHNIDNSNRWYSFTSMEFPSFNTKAEAKSWFKSNNKQM